MDKCYRRQHGFTLLEVIVALSVLAVSLTILLRIFSSSSQIAAITDDYYRALQIAESQLALLQTKEGRRVNLRGEIDDKFQWRATVSEYQISIKNPLFQSDLIEEQTTYLTPYQYDVTVRWGNAKEREIHLSTIRLGARQ